MKILIDARLYGLENAGIGRYVMSLVGEISRLDRKNSYTVLLRKKYFETLDLPANWEKVEVDIAHYSVREQFVLPGIIEKNNPDLVHFPHFNVPIFYSGRFIVTIHDILMHKQVGPEATTLSLPQYLIKRLAYKLVFKKAVVNSEKIIVPSQVAREELKSYYQIDPAKVKVTYEGVGERFFRKAKAGVYQKYSLNRPYFIYAGNAYPHKNLARAVEATVYLNKVLKQRARLAIVSARSVFTTRLQYLVKQHDAQKYVKLLGFVPDSDLVSLYQDAEGFVYPSLSEGFGLPGLEAMAVGTISLVSEIPIFKEIYKNSVVYFDPYNLEDIARKMKEVLSMGVKERQKIIRNGQEFVKRYSWAKMARETRQVYNEALR